jgi:hypothetical protein
MKATEVISLIKVTAQSPGRLWLNLEELTPQAH